MTDELSHLFLNKLILSTASLPSEDEQVLVSLLVSV